MKDHTRMSNRFTAAQALKILKITKTKLSRWSKALGFVRIIKDHREPILYSPAQLYCLMFVRTMTEHSYSPASGAWALRRIYESSGKKTWEDFWRDVGMSIFSVFGDKRHCGWPCLVSDSNPLGVRDTEYLAPDYGEAVPVTVAFFLKEIVRAVGVSIRTTSPSTKYSSEETQQKPSGLIPSYAPRKIRINWVESDKIRSGYMHGVEFYHKSIGTRHAENRPPIAFIEGYNWFHNTSQKSVKVKILGQDAPALSRSVTPAARIVKDIHVAVKRFFEESPRSEHITDVVSARWNA